MPQRTRSPGRKLTDFPSKRRSSLPSRDLRKRSSILSTLSLLKKEDEPNEYSSHSFSLGYSFSYSAPLREDSLFSNEGRDVNDEKQMSIIPVTNFYTSKLKECEVSRDSINIKEYEISLFSEPKDSLECPSEEIVVKHRSSSIRDSQSIISQDIVKTDSRAYPSPILNYVSYLIFILLTIVILICSVLIGIASFHQLCLNQDNILFPNAALTSNLSSCVIQQDQSISDISEFLFGERLSNPSLMWLVGPSGTGKTKTVQIIEHIAQDSFVYHKVYSSLIPKSYDDRKYRAKHLSSNMNFCKPNIVIFDGFDEADDITINFIQIFLSELKENLLFFDKSVKKNVKVIVVGSKHSDIIINYLKNEKNVQDSKLHFVFLQQLLTINSVFRQLSIDFITIPFMPLNETLVKRCIMQELNLKLLNTECNSSVNNDLSTLLNEAGLSIDNIISGVMELLEVFPGSHFVKSGCKRIPQLVSLFLARRKQ